MPFMGYVAFAMGFMVPYLADESLTMLHMIPLQLAFYGMGALYVTR